MLGISRDPAQAGQLILARRVLHLEETEVAPQGVGDVYVDDAAVRPLELATDSRRAACADTDREVDLGRRPDFLCELPAHAGEIVREVVRRPAAV